MHSAFLPVPPVDTEARFGPSDGSDAFAWELIPVE